MKTGKGWVKEHKGQYYDALHVKNGIVKILGDPRPWGACGLNGLKRA